MVQKPDPDAEARALFSTVAFLVGSALKKPPGGGRYPALGRKVASALDAKLVAPQGSACRAGCDACCHRVVLASPPEVAWAAAHVDQSFSPEQRETLRGRLRAYVSEVGRAQGRDLTSLRPACPFLVDRRCTIYDARPIACRTKFSTDVAACEAARDEPAMPFPETPAESRLGLAATKAILDGLLAHIQFSNVLDFGRAAYLLLARDEPSEPEPGADLFQLALPANERLAYPESGGPGSYPVYGPGEEPAGVLDLSDLTEARYHLLARGDFSKADAVAPRTHPAHIIFRRTAPGVLRTAEEVQAGKARYVETFHRFVDMDADPRQKFDAIQEFSTLGLSYLQGDDLALLSEIGDFETIELASRLLPDLSEPIEGPRKPGRLRVGYIGDQLDTSSSGFWATGWLRNHGPDIETFAFDLSRGKAPSSDAYRSLAEHFYHLPGPIPEAARLIKGLDLDALIYPDLASRGRPIQFATFRLARTQCAGWGGPGTTGLPHIDVFLSGDFMEPEDGQAHHRERLVRLPCTGLCYPRREMEIPRFTKLDFGLDDGPLILCAQTAAKLLPQWDFVFREISERTGRPIVFFRYALWPHVDLQRRLERAGVRTIFMPVVSPPAFRALLRLADVALDSIGWSGGVTAIETVGARLPTVTLPGPYRKSRHTAAFLRAAGAPGLIAREVADYIDLATNPDRRREAATDMEPDALFEDLTPVRALDEFLLNSTPGA